MNKRQIGSAFVAASYLLLLVSTFANHVHVYHQREVVHDMDQYIGPWPVHLLLSLVIVEVYLCWVPMRRGERFAWWLALIPLLLLGATRLASDPRCLGSLHVHGCHMFLITLLLGFVGLGLVKLGR